MELSADEIKNLNYDDYLGLFVDDADRYFLEVIFPFSIACV